MFKDGMFCQPNRAGRPLRRRLGGDAAMLARVRVPPRFRVRIPFGRRDRLGSERPHFLCLRRGPGSERPHVLCLRRGPGSERPHVLCLRRGPGASDPTSYACDAVRGASDPTPHACDAVRGASDPTPHACDAVRGAGPLACRSPLAEWESVSVGSRTREAARGSRDVSSRAGEAARGESSGGAPRAGDAQYGSRLSRIPVPLRRQGRPSNPWRGGDWEKRLRSQTWRRTETECVFWCASRVLTRFARVPP